MTAKGNSFLDRLSYVKVTQETRHLNMYIRTTTELLSLLSQRS